MGRSNNISSHLFIVDCILLKQHSVRRDDLLYFIPVYYLFGSRKIVQFVNVNGCAFFEEKRYHNFVENASRYHPNANSSFVMAKSAFTLDRMMRCSPYTLSGLSIPLIENQLHFPSDEITFEIPVNGAAISVSLWRAEIYSINILVLAFNIESINMNFMQRLAWVRHRKIGNYSASNCTMSWLNN